MKIVILIHKVVKEQKENIQKKIEELTRNVNQKEKKIEEINLKEEEENL